MTSKTVLNIFLALALAGLLALAIYEPGKTEPPDAKKLTTLEPETVQSIRIERPAHLPILLKKMSGQWKMQSPLKAPANLGRIQQLLKVLQAKSIARYAMNQVDTAQMQLGTPSLTLMFDDVLLRFGTTDALGGSRYLQAGDVVHLITDRYSYLAKGVATDFVSLALLPEGNRIAELALPGLRLTQQDGRWLTNEKSEDADMIQRLLDEWRHGRALRVSELDKSPVQLIATQLIAVTLGEDANKTVLKFELLRNETGIILQRHDLGIQYHFSIETGQRLLSLITSNAEIAP